MNGMKIKVTTNNQVRFTTEFGDLPAKIQEQFGEDALDHDFVYYKGVYYDLDEFFTTIGFKEDELKEWNGYKADSYFSGVVVRYVEADTVVMGTYIS
jgi:hypothetical protein